MDGKSYLILGEKNLQLEHEKMEIKSTNTTCIQIQSKAKSFAKAALGLLKVFYGLCFFLIEILLNFNTLFLFTLPVYFNK